jgi:hydroxymethylbilane synthase
MTRPMRLAGRASPLSRWQLGAAAQALRRVGVEVETVVLDTSGDRDLQTAIDDLPSDAPFVDTLESALLRGEVDAAVHSLKDLPIVPTAGLALPAMLPRGSVAEAVVSRDGRPLDAWPAGARIGTSAARRRLQVAWDRPDLRCEPIRGPVDARVRQVAAGSYDAAILAVAGLARLGLEHLIAETLTLDRVLPAPGQGAIVVQTRSNDALASAVARADDASTRVATELERAVQQALESPDWVVAAYAEVVSGDLTLQARVLSRHTRRRVDARGQGREAASVLSDVLADLGAGMRTATTLCTPTPEVAR